jgi:hypothetical protein
MLTGLTDANGLTWVNYTNSYIKGGLWLNCDAIPAPSNDIETMAQYRKPFLMGIRPHKT